MDETYENKTKSLHDGEFFYAQKGKRTNPTEMATGKLGLEMRNKKAMPWKNGQHQESTKSSIFFSEESRWELNVEKPFLFNIFYRLLLLLYTTGSVINITR